MRRKAVIKHKPTPRHVSLSELAGKAHFHFCSDRSCRLIYEDACEQPATNGRCQTCRGVRRELMRHRDPHDCCLGNCVQVVDKEQIVRYSLAGPGPWFQCSVCARCHGWPCT